MTKAAVKALDALEMIVPMYTQGMSRRTSTWPVPKRGWTTWLVGAVESIANNRVKAICPLVLDALNLGFRPPSISVLRCLVLCAAGLLRGKLHGLL